MAEEQPEDKNTKFDLLGYLHDTFGIQKHVDKDESREEIIRNISFKGLAAYVLVASIIVASVGLNANSVAVVIGAMLISPLMGPIVGLGYSVAVNDWKTLKKSLVNFGIMVGIALVTSFVYFSIAPLNTLTEQLRGRIEPTSLDVGIAFFGGLAGIAALSSRIRNANVIAGVAIATALMPPLCTAGYGFAQGMEEIGYKDYTGFTAGLNALYLFFINSVFIATATFVFVKVARFPLAKYQNKAQAKRTNWIIASIAILTIIPSSFIFYDIINDELYNSRVQSFLQKEVKSIYKNVFIDINDPSLTTNDSLRYITISTITQQIPSEVIQNWNTLLKDQYKLKNTELIIQQGQSISSKDIQNSSKQLFSNIYELKEYQIQEKDSVINAMRQQINSLNSDSIPFLSVSNELKALYPNLESFAYGNVNFTNYKGRNYIPTFVLYWEDSKDLSPTELVSRASDEVRIQEYLKKRLALDTIQILR